MRATNQGSLYLQGGGRMKPYRGTLLAAGMLLATLQLFGCGHAEDWEKTTDIRLSAPAPEGLNEVVFTVKSPPPAEGYACDTILQYRAEGAGVNINWANVPGTETTRIFVLQPRQEGTLSVMVGGKQEVFDRCVPVLKSMAASVVRVGNIGAGNVTKLANQVIVALNIAALSEAMVLAAKAGVEPELVYQAIRGGLAGSTVMDAKAPLMLDRKFNPGFKINLHIKDLKNALETSEEVGAPLPLTASVMEIMQALSKEGLGDSDHGAIVRHFEKQANIEVKRSTGV